MAVRPRKDSGSWIIDFRASNGERVRQTVKAASRRAAEQQEDALRVEVEGRLKEAALRQAGGGRVRYTLMEAYLKYQHEEGDHHKSGATERYHARAVLARMPDLPLDQLRTFHVNDYIKARQGDTRAARRGLDGKARRVPISNATINREVELLKRVMRTAGRKWNAEVGNDQPDFTALRLEETSERVRELSEDECRRLFRHLRSDLHPLVRFALATGIRFTNCRLLRWDQVDMEERVVHIRVKSRRDRNGRPVTLPLGDDAMAVLAARAGIDPEHVFTWANGANAGKRKWSCDAPLGAQVIYSKAGFGDVFRRGLENAGIRDFRFHDTRHDFASKVLRATGDLKATSKLLAHSSIVTTARYAHVDMSDMRAALDRTAAARQTPRLRKVSA